ncbi:cytidine deaminase [Nannocystaceae bacterium ST9]
MPRPAPRSGRGWTRPSDRISTMVDLAATPLGSQLDRRLAGPGARGFVSADELRELAVQTGLDEDAVVLACLAWADRWARPPISQFRVGALALGGSGALYLGANIEFEGLPLCETIHAEQAAIVHAWLGGETELRAIATSAAPCGFCRQFMLELPEPRPRILVPGGPARSLDSLLPAHFGPDDLGRTPTLLRAGPHGLRLADDDGGNPLVRMTLDAANHSSAPYTESFAAVGLATAQGERHVGRVAESVAYNPTLGPMQAAMIALHMQGGRLESIREAVLIEIDGAPVQHARSAAQVLESLAPTLRLRRFAASRAP